jgi:hypothetical protein
MMTVKGHAMRKREAETTRSGRRDRVIRLLDLRFGGNQREAARALGKSQALISRLVHGFRPVTDQFLEALAGLPDVNPRWVFEGVGDPLLPSTAGTLPVSDVVLPGEPMSYMGLMRGDRHPVAQTLERGTRYWLRLNPRSPLVSFTELQIRAGDLLLVETAQDHLDRSDVLNRQLVALAVAGEDGVDYAFAQIILESGRLFAKLYRAPTATAIGVVRAVPAQVTTGKRVRQRILGPKRLGDSQEAGEWAGRMERPPAAAISPKSGLVRLSNVHQIVGLVLKLERAVLIRS